MRRPLFVSVAFHLAILLMAAIGIPLSRPDEAPMAEAALSVELVDVAEKSNLPPAPSPKMDVKPEEKPKPPEQARAPEPVKREQPPPPPPPPPAAKVEPAPQAEAEPQKAAPPPPEPEPEPAPAVEPAPAPTFAPKRKAEAPSRPEPEPEKTVAQAEPKKAEPKIEPKPETRPEPKAEAKPKAPETAKPKADAAKPKPEAEMDFAAVLKSLDAKRQATPGEPSRGETRTGSDAANAQGKNASTSYDAGLPVTMSEIDMVRRQIEQCWNLPAGARDAPNLRVTIVVDMNADGTPRSAAIDDQGQMQASPFYRVAAESALRAVLNPRCHPFKLPREKYERWKTMTLVFDPKDMFGT